MGGKKRKKGGEEDRFKTWKIELSLSLSLSHFLFHSRSIEVWRGMGDLGKIGPEKGESVWSGY